MCVCVQEKFREHCELGASAFVNLVANTMRLMPAAAASALLLDVARARAVREQAAARSLLAGHVTKKKAPPPTTGGANAKNAAAQDEDLFDLHQNTHHSSPDGFSDQGGSDVETHDDEHDFF